MRLGGRSLRLWVVGEMRLPTCHVDYPCCGCGEDAWIIRPAHMCWADDFVCVECGLSGEVSGRG